MLTPVPGHLEMVGAAGRRQVCQCWPSPWLQLEHQKKRQSNRQVWAHFTWCFERSISLLLPCLPSGSWIWLLFKVHVGQKQHCVSNSTLGQKQITVLFSLLWWIILSSQDKTLVLWAASKLYFVRTSQPIMLLAVFKIPIQAVIAQCTLQSWSVAALTPDYTLVICSDIYTAKRAAVPGTGLCLIF